MSNTAAVSNPMIVDQDWDVVLAYNSLPKQKDGKLFNGALEKLANEKGVGVPRVRRLITAYNKAKETNQVPSFGHHKKGNVGRKTKKTEKVVRDMKTINKENLKRPRKTTVRMMKAELDKRGESLSIGTVAKYIKEEGGQTRWWHVKPLLQDEHKQKREAFVRSKIDWTKREFINHENTVHVDEKWFYLVQECGKVLVFPEDELPAQYTQHKNSIPKIMFLAAVCKPQIDPNGDLFSGKICLHSFIEEVAAKRNSKNRPAGTVEKKPIAVGASEYREALRRHVITMIRRRLHWKKGEKIIIQHDGAKPHGGGGNKEYFDRIKYQYGWHIEVETQPAQSPDLNVNDLGFFAGLQARSEQLRNDCESIETLIHRVQQAWRLYSPYSLDACFGVLHEVYRLILLHEGGNKFRTLHSIVRRRQDAGMVPVNYSIDFDEDMYSDSESSEHVESILPSSKVISI